MTIAFDGNAIARLDRNGNLVTVRDEILNQPNYSAEVNPFDDFAPWNIPIDSDFQYSGDTYYWYPGSSIMLQINYPWWAYDSWGWYDYNVNNIYGYYYDYNYDYNYDSPDSDCVQILDFSY